MLKRTFVHLPGFGFKAEEKLWNQGVETWDHLRDGVTQFFKADRCVPIIKNLDKSFEALENGRTDFFYRHLPRAALWRLVPDFIKEIAFLDIETTGLSLPPRNTTTSIAIIYKGKLYQEFEHRRKRDLIKWIDSDCKLICTYYGEVFDVPFLRKEFGVKLTQAHLDLCFWLRRLGYTGGLKQVERNFKSVPKRITEGIDGFSALILWNRYLNGSKAALRTLMTYNAEDTIALNHLIKAAIQIELKKIRHFPLHNFAFMKVPKVKNQVDKDIVRELRSMFDNT